MKPSDKPDDFQADWIRLHTTPREIAAIVAHFGSVPAAIAGRRATIARRAAEGKDSPVAKAQLARLLELPDNVCRATMHNCGSSAHDIAQDAVHFAHAWDQYSRKHPIDWELVIWSPSLMEDLREEFRDAGFRDEQISVVFRHAKAQWGNAEAIANAIKAKAFDAMVASSLANPLD